MTQKELRALADKEVIEFVDYVFDFYGPTGLYPLYFPLTENTGVTKLDIFKAMKIHLEEIQSEEDAMWLGDSTDREQVRDILLRDLGYVFPQ